MEYAFVASASQQGNIVTLRDLPVAQLVHMRAAFDHRGAHVQRAANPGSRYCVGAGAPYGRGSTRGVPSTRW